MWITKDVDLPERLISAQRDGSLVVFAGAGVSIGPPSSLPAFEDLARRIGAEALKPAPGESEEFDRYLGRLERDGVPVHLRAHQIVSDSSSTPTAIHSNLLRLFPGGSARIVTTNFDLHFSTAAAVLGFTVETFRGPALPLGRDFNGVVYLHGCTSQDPRHLVLTDRDFGQAYLTDAWATRFLVDMFAKYTVLFVGYSHDDVVMRYLARALPPETSRFVVTATPSNDWDLLGVQPILYEKADEEPRHGQLEDALKAWADDCNMGLLDHEARIKDAVSGPPPEEPERAAYLSDALTSEARTEFFTRHAHDVQWLKWAETQPRFQELFDPRREVGLIGRVLSYWFADVFLCSHLEEALGVLQGRGGRMHPALVQAIIRHLAHQKPSQDCLSRWVPLLLQNVSPDDKYDSIEYLLSVCEWPEGRGTAIALFEFLTRPQIRLKPSFSGLVDGKPATDADIFCRGEEHWLREAWTKFFAPNLSDLASELASLLTQQLDTAHRLLKAMNKADDRWDSISFGRSAIEPHEQDAHPLHGSMDLLISAARDVLESLLTDNPQIATGLRESWNNAGVPILKRLAVHGVSIDPQMTADEKLRWIIDQGYVFAYEVKHEIFHLLETAYPDASDALKEEMLRVAEEGIPEARAERLKDKTKEYAKYNLMVWLHSIAPDHQLTKERFDVLQAVHPDFGPREHPDLESWVSSGFVGTQSPKTVEQLLAIDPEEELDYLTNYKAEFPLEGSREGLLGAVAAACNQSLEWALKLAAALKKAALHTSDLWSALLEGWTKASLSDTDWEAVIGEIRGLREPCEHMYSIARFLVERAPDREGGVPEKLLNDFVEVAIALWKTCEGSTEAETPERWLDRAINHWAGKIVEFELHVLSFEWKRLGPEWSGLPELIREHFEHILAGNTGAAELGRAVFGSQLHFLFAADRSWTEENLLSQFDWNDARRAEQVWHGFLVWGQFNEALLEKLLPLFRESIAHLSSELEVYRDRFVEFLASIAVGSKRDPLDDGWLEKLIADGALEDRVNFARHIQHSLRNASGEVAGLRWEHWIRNYWDKRLAGVPLPLDVKEIEEMVNWTIHLGPAFDEAVTRLTASTPTNLEHFTFVYRELAEGDLVANHSGSMARLLSWLTRGAQLPFHNCPDVTKLLRLLSPTAADRADLIAVCEEMGRLMCPDANDLRTAIDA